METGKTKNQLIRELAEAQRRLAELEAAEAKRQQAEKALRESEEKYRAIFEQASDSVVLIDRSTTEIVDFNDQAYRNLGYTREEFAGLKITDVNPFVSTEVASRRLNKLAIGEPSTLETKHRAKNGEIRDVIVTVRAVDIGGKRYTIGIWHDITERKRAEQALRESEEFSTSLLENAPNPIIVFNTDMSVRYTNPAFEKLTGFTPAEITGIKPPFPWWRKEAGAEYATAAKLKSDLDSGHIERERFYRRKNGEALWVEVNAALINHGGALRYYLINWVDITERKRMEDEIRLQSEAVAHASEGVHLIRAKDAVISFANPRFHEMFGYEQGELIGKHVSILNAPGELTPEEVAGKILEALEKNGTWDGEVYNIKKDGTRFWTRAAVSTIEHSIYGKVWVTVQEDITERKQAEQALRESEEKYRAIFEQAVDSIAVIDIDSGEILDFNDTACQNLGYTREEFARLKIQEIDPSIPTNSFRMARENRLIKNGVEVFEAKHRTRSGEIRDVRISATLLNTDGKNITMCIWHDITEEKRMADALRESEEKYRAIFEHAARSVVIIDLKDSRIVDFNESAHKNLGYTREEFARFKISDFDVLQTDEVIQNITDVIRQKGEDSFETKHRTKSGEIRDIRVYGKNFSIRGESFIMAIWHDITEEKKAEARLREAETLKEIDRLRSQLLANVSHELRTPLASIKGFATMFLEYERKLKSHEKRGYMETINRNVDRLTELVDQLLDMSRLDAGTLALDRSPTSLGRLMRETVAEARVRTPSHHFTLDLPKTVPRINIDARRIRQVLDNCIGNAVSYSPAGTEITVSARKFNHEILITITDQGIGIPEEDLPHVFDRMFRSLQRPLPGGGAGLGLSISKGLVQAHGGRMWIESEEGKGSRCFFTLPQPIKPGKSQEPPAPN